MSSKTYWLVRYLPILHKILFSYHDMFEDTVPQFVWSNWGWSAVLNMAFKIGKQNISGMHYCCSNLYNQALL